MALQRQLQAHAEKADRVVVAYQGDRFEDLHLVEMLHKRRPSHLGDGSAVDEIVDQGDQGLLRWRPAGGIAAFGDGGRHLLRREADLVGKEGDMNAPFVLAPRQRAGAVDDDFALA